MNNAELDSILKRARLPSIPDESQALFPRRIVDRLKHPALPAPRQRNFWPRLAWAGSLVACLILAFAMGHWHGRTQTEAALANNSLANLKLIRETMAMFPQRVRAIVQDDQGLKLVLSDNADVPVSAPLYIHICDGKHCSSVVTFSGQEILMAGQKITVLEDANGGIILEGNKFVWSSTERIRADGALNIQVKNLGLTAM